MSSYESVGARLAIEHATVTAVRLLERCGIESVVLKGPWLAALLYEPGESRTSSDVDLLVDDLTAASGALEADGYLRLVDWTPGMERHAWTHAKEGAVSVDLHRTLVGIGAQPAHAWEVFRHASQEGDIAGAHVRVPKLPVQAMIVALHAAQHGRAAEKPMDDLKRALQRFERPVWNQAAAYARELAAEPAFCAGLELVDMGQELARELGLNGPTSRTARLRASSPPPTALGLDRMSQLRGRERTSFLLGKLFPPREFMQSRDPLARLGRTGMALAYAHRLGYIARQLPGGAKSLWEANKRDTRS